MMKKTNEKKGKTKATKPKTEKSQTKRGPTEETLKVFLNNLEESMGIISAACDKSKISRVTYYDWRNKYPEFAEKADEITERQCDFVEHKLLENIQANDTKAIVFYLKTKGKKRGYNMDREPAQTTSLPTSGNIQGNTQNLLASKIEELTRQLKEANKYSPELTIQIQQTAILLVKVDAMRDEILSEKHQSVKIEVSREGNERMVVNQLDKLFLDYMSEAKANLRALGMNVDAKERRTDGEDTMFDRLATIGSRPDD